MCGGCARRRDDEYRRHRYASRSSSQSRRRSATGKSWNLSLCAEGSENGVIAAHLLTRWMPTGRATDDRLSLVCVPVTHRSWSPGIPEDGVPGRAAPETASISDRRVGPLTESSLRSGVQSRARLADEKHRPQACSGEIGIHRAWVGDREKRDLRAEVPPPSLRDRRGPSGIPTVLLALGARRFAGTDCGSVYWLERHRGAEHAFRESLRRGSTTFASAISGHHPVSFPGGRREGAHGLPNLWWRQSRWQAVLCGLWRTVIGRLLDVRCTTHGWQALLWRLRIAGRSCDGFAGLTGCSGRAQSRAFPPPPRAGR
jgi:hypothetical protein